MSNLSEAELELSYDIFTGPYLGGTYTSNGKTVQVTPSSFADLEEGQNLGKVTN